MEVYACLLGNWINLSNDPNCKIGERHLTPNQWLAEIWSLEPKEEKDSSEYIWIRYKSIDYRINPAFIQIVVE